ncbi:MAG: hypothetical protein M1840_007147 [Geoglossum simile]|nr:MAG: hypothetical protein M1840_007147 [Geoglossum simile]
MGGSDDQRVPIAIGATKNERRQSRDAAIAGALGPGILARNYISSSEHGMGGSTASKSDENGRAVPSTIGPRGLETTVRASPPRDQRGGDRLEPHDSRQSKPRDSTHENQAARDVALGTRAAGTGSVTYKHHDHIEQYGDDFAPPTQQGYADLTGVSGYTGHTHPNSTTAFGTADTSHQNTIGSHRQTEAGKDEPHHRRLLGFLHRDKDKKRGQGGGGSSAKQHHQSEPKAGNASIEMEHKYDERRRREFRGIRGTDASSTDPVGSDGSNHSVEKAGVHQPILDEAERQQKEPAKDEKTHHGLLGTLHHDKSKKCGEERDKKADYEAAAATASMITASEAIPGPTDQRLNGHRQSVRNKLSKEPPPNRYTADSAHAPASGASTAPSSDPGK